MILLLLCCWQRWAAAAEEGGGGGGGRSDGWRNSPDPSSQCFPVQNWEPGPAASLPAFKSEENWEMSPSLPLTDCLRCLLPGEHCSLLSSDFHHHHHHHRHHLLWSDWHTVTIIYYVVLTGYSQPVQMRVITLYIKLGRADLCDCSVMSNKMMLRILNIYISLSSNLSGSTASNYAISQWGNKF